MVRDRGYSGSIVQLRRTVARLRPQKREAFLQLQVFPGEQAQVDWEHFGHVMVGRAKRAMSCFVITLSYSRALYLEFFFDQTTENFLRGHVHAFEAWLKSEGEHLKMSYSPDQSWGAVFITAGKPKQPPRPFRD